jgi:leucyl aminopeptidase
MFEDEFNPPVRYADEVLKGTLTKLHQKKQLTGEYKSVKALPFNNKPEWLVIVGLGKKDAMTLERLRRLAGVSAKAARQLGRNFATNIHLLCPGSAYDNAKAVTTGTILGLYQFTKYKTQDVDKIKTIDNIVLLDTEKQKPELTRGCNEAQVIADSVNIARDLVDAPPAELTPRQLAQEAKRICKAVGCSVDTWDRKDLEKKGMNAILGVSRGSDQEPQFIIIEYGPKKQKPIVLAGKGITYDTGGLSIKTPYTSMVNMKGDMAGAAAVIATLRAAALLKMQQRIIGLIPAAENAINGNAQKPDDIIKSFNGKTIEVINTDAEGRLVLADTVAYAETLQPQAIIDLATLTGACLVALGYLHAGLFTRNETLLQRLEAASQATGDLLWRMPMTEEYAEALKSDVADIRNLGKDSYAGAIMGAVFIQSFVEKTPFAHIDIAGPAFLAEEKEYSPKQGTGFGVRLLVDMLQKWETME